MHVFTYISTFLISFLFFAGCINNKNSNAAREKAESMDLLLANLVGMYAGELPCADCEAIQTVLEIHRDHSYKLTYVYQGKSVDEFVKEGDWEVNKNKLILNGVDYTYKIEREGLVQLDLSGNVIKGDLADCYELTRIE